MSTRQPTDRQRRLTSLGLPLVSVGIGIAYLIAGLLGDQPGFGVFGLLLMTGLALVLWLVRRRSETVQGLLDRRDERINAIDLKATAFAGMVVIVAVIAAFVVEIARSHDGMPYAWLGAAGGIAYVSALIVQRMRG
jgi:hypothetical protein